MPLSSPLTRTVPVAPPAEPLTLVAPEPPVVEAADAGDEREEPPAPRVPSRAVAGTDDQTWLVREFVAHPAGHHLAATSLVADNGRVVRRLWCYPGDWMTVDAAQLISLIEGPVRAVA